MPLVSDLMPDTCGDFRHIYPIRKDWLFEGPESIRNLGLSPANEAAILGCNARRLFRLN